MKTKLKSIPENTVIHTPTEEEANELLAILHANGYKWSGNRRLTKSNCWNAFKAEMCYEIEITHTVRFNKLRYLGNMLLFGILPSSHSPSSKSGIAKKNLNQSSYWGTSLK